MTLSLELYRSVPRYLAARALGSRIPGALSGPVAPLRLVHRTTPRLPAPGWVRIRPRIAGICGSDLATISGRSSFYFTAITSMPFVPGHEVVGELLDDCDDLRAGQRVVLNPLLSCEVRGIEPMCIECKNGEPGLCERVGVGHVSAGLQTGYCAGTGGGWSEELIAHRAQLTPVPETISDLDAVMVEPLACAIHAVQRAAVAPDATVLVVGAGTVGLLTVLALRSFSEAGAIVVVAKHGTQAALARS
ncbi:MAG: alcohol dehydrogenase catalytic domain-containing protein, partial [Actinobacteria bacterium]|nr:alcohol dehydrogenase catalytic domain-containing protein [Actinomycetota bacterium]